MSSALCARRTLRHGFLAFVRIVEARQRATVRARAAFRRIQSQAILKTRQHVQQWSRSLRLSGLKLLVYQPLTSSGAGAYEVPTLSALHLLVYEAFNC